ncbi:MAG: biotin--[acetyl-CoA-carboxylase] ligase [Propionibacteriales bacterium]|nr:biotin--[acetyl-CoA-carboxylase] ligase [Propionibacteriales bacterium]
MPDTGSTNADLTARAGDGAPHGAVLIADHQRTGRGRLRRSWSAPPGASVALSVLLRPTRTTGWSWLPLVCGIAVADAVRAAGANAVLKWPNDVLVDDLKLAGILVERTQTPAGPAVIIGCGINTTASIGDLPVPTATSIAAVGLGITPLDLVVDVLLRLDRLVTFWGDEANDDLLGDMYSNRCSSLGQRVRAQLADTEVVGVATGIDADGGLLVHTADAEVTVVAGDVVHLRGNH